MSLLWTILIFLFLFPVIRGASYPGHAVMVNGTQPDIVQKGTLDALLWETDHLLGKYRAHKIDIAPESDIYVLASLAPSEDTRLIEKIKPELVRQRHSAVFWARAKMAWLIFWKLIVAPVAMLYLIGWVVVWVLKGFSNRTA